ncbi:MAG: hypothetical protein DRI74_08105 [Bacteroidetes bacterium]|nr:MAG: hypothetical protein DRI74_08105 [Bacteroidota bacterium]
MIGIINISNYTELGSFKNQLSQNLRQVKKTTVRKNRTIQHKVAGALFAHTIQYAAIKEKLI